MLGVALTGYLREVQSAVSGGRREPPASGGPRAPALDCGEGDKKYATPALPQGQWGHLASGSPGQQR